MCFLIYLDNRGKGKNNIRKEAAKEIQERPVKYVEYKGYYIALDVHGEKKHTKNVKLTTEAVQNWGENNNAAIFSEKFRDNYKDALGKVIRIWADNIEAGNGGADNGGADNGGADNKAKAYVCLEEDVGVDKGTSKQGEWTSVVELYYGGKLGSHMRPKAESWLSENDIIYHALDTTCNMH